MSSFQIHTRHDVSRRLCHAKVDSKFRILHPPTTQWQRPRRYDTNCVGECGRYDRSWEAFNLSRLLHDLRGQKDGASPGPGKRKGDRTESPAIVAGSITSQPEQ